MSTAVRASHDRRPRTAELRSRRSLAALAGDGIWALMFINYYTASIAGKYELSGHISAASRTVEVSPSASATSLTMEFPLYRFDEPTKLLELWKSLPQRVPLRLSVSLVN
ncbi:hypothetical protein EV702DRAFT_1200610 [Suillus placidus]|uniref:Uncharacterized protein n=1 Tax=Suillus placidus TaxID=48579 RepID=A0A9P6ZP57_9AGAM|nr:hypothetical protein EV702DRAFT_1200610 [Suillus placidus]